MVALAKRKPNRIKEYDYHRNGAYFVTVCAKNHANIFGKIVPGSRTSDFPHIELTNLGACVDDTIRRASHDEVKIEHYIIMPNHLHMIVIINATAGDRGRSPLQYVIRTIKSYVSKHIGYSIWQKSFYDHIIRDEEDYLRVVDYIKDNPLKWEMDKYYNKDVM
jgi:REP element-mobilizing transposase RayT